MERRKGADAGSRMLRAVQKRHPPFKEAVLADLTLALRQRGDQRDVRSRAAFLREVIRVVWLSDAFGSGSV